MSERSGLRGPCREREAGGALGDLRVAERDQQGEAVQPRSMQVAEGGCQRGVVVLRGRGLQDGRGTPP
jgi:hypothetical protein